MAVDEPEAVLVARDLTIGYGASRRVAGPLDMELRRGEVTCLLGANGAGKSTLLRTLARQQPALSGRIEVEGRDLSSATLREVARMMSVVYTERTNAGALTVREVVGLGRQPFTGFFGRLDDADREIVDCSLEAVGISALADRFVATLSDGERQKTMIARGVAQQAPVMILDEPTSFLDVASRLEVMELLRRLAAEQRTAVLLSTHDVGDALNIANHLWLITPDHQFISGPTDLLIANGSMDRIFPGRNIIFDPSARDFRLK